MGVALDGLGVVDPVGYLDMTKLLHHAAGVYTDSGGFRRKLISIGCHALRYAMKPSGPRRSLTAGTVFGGRPHHVVALRSASTAEGAPLSRSRIYADFEFRIVTR